jgi:hypothetical protein
MNWFKRYKLSQVASLPQINPTEMFQHSQQTTMDLDLLEKQVEEIQEQIKKFNQDSTTNPANKPNNDTQIQALNKKISDIKEQQTTLMGLANASNAQNPQRKGKPQGTYQGNPAVQNLWNSSTWSNPFSGRRSTNQI